MAKKVPQPLAEVQQATGDDLSGEDLRAKIESILYCIPDGVTIDKLGETLAKHSLAARSGTSSASEFAIIHRGRIKEVLEQMQSEYAGRRGIQLVSENNMWKFKVPDEHIPIIRDVAEPEFDKSVLETLAYIAWRSGSRQCDVVRVRSNKAYNHIKLLIEKGFIESSKAGLSKWLEPTKKFYEYFKLQQGQKLETPNVSSTNPDEVIAAGMKALFG